MSQTTFLLSNYELLRYQPIFGTLVIVKFYEEFQELLENLVTLYSEINIFGDFNFHLDKSSAVTTSFGDILMSFDLKQHVAFPTHIHGQWLDLVITRSTCDTIQALTVVDGLADHHTVIVDVKIPRTPVLSKRRIFYRPIHKIDIAAFIGDILKSDLVRNLIGDLFGLCKQYHHVLETLLNKHAPVTSKSVSQKAPFSVDDSRHSAVKEAPT